MAIIFSATPRRRRLLLSLLAASATLALAGLGAPANATQLGSPSGGNAVDLPTGSPADFSYSFFIPGNSTVGGRISVHDLKATYSYTCGTTSSATPAGTLVVSFADKVFVNGTSALGDTTSQPVASGCGTETTHILPLATFTGKFGSDFSANHLNVEFMIQGNRSSTNIAHVGAFVPLAPIANPLPIVID